MKLKKNNNINTLIERFAEMQNQCANLSTDFKQAIKLLDDSKLGITELNFNIDEELMRFNHTFLKIEELIKNL